MSTPTPDTQSLAPGDVKPGHLTTEFWLTVAMIVVSTGLAIAQIIPGEEAVIAAGVLTIIYKALRTLVKIRTAASAALAEMYRSEADCARSEAEIAAARTFSAEPPTELLRTPEEESELLNTRSHGMSGFTCWQVLAAIVWVGFALALAFAMSSCASTTVYQGGQKILTTQANAASLAFKQGDTSLEVTGLDHSTPTRAGGSVIGTTGTAVAGAAAAFLTK